MMSGKELVIITRTAEGQSEFRSACSLEETEKGVCVRYRQQEDDCLLEVTDGALTMRREGALSLGAVFVPGETTQFRLTELGRSSSIPVYTSVYRFRRDPFCLELIYVFLLEKVRFHLSVMLSEGP